MRKSRGRKPKVEPEADIPVVEAGPGMSMQPGSSDAPDGWSQKKQGLNDSDVAALVRAVRSGMSWFQAKQTVGMGIVDSALEGWREEIHRRAGKAAKPVLVKPDAPPARLPAAVEKLPGRVAGQLDIALAALIAGRADLAMRVLRELGADAVRAPDKWAEQLVAAAPRAVARVVEEELEVDADAEPEVHEAPPRKRGRARRSA